jgi:hypothetical protein
MPHSFLTSSHSGCTLISAHHLHDRQHTSLRGTPADLPREMREPLGVLEPREPTRREVVPERNVEQVRERERVARDVPLAPKDLLVHIELARERLRELVHARRVHRAADHRLDDALEHERLRERVKVRLLDREGLLILCGTPRVPRRRHERRAELCGEVPADRARLEEHEPVVVLPRAREYPVRGEQVGARTRAGSWPNGLSARYAADFSCCVRRSISTNSYGVCVSFRTNSTRWVYAESGWP